MPRLEEIDDLNDIDDLDMDLAELDPSLRTPIAPKITPTVVRSPVSYTHLDVYKRQGYK